MSNPQELYPAMTEAEFSRLVYKCFRMHKKGNGDSWGPGLAHVHGIGLFQIVKIGKGLTEYAMPIVCYLN